jgi:hypothetical protein
MNALKTREDATNPQMAAAETWFIWELSKQGAEVIGTTSSDSTGI